MNQNVKVEEALAAAVAHHTNGHLEAAETLYRQVLAADPGNPQVLHLLGAALLQGGRAAEAAALIERAVARAEPVPPHYRGNLAEAYRLLGRFEAALSQVRAALAVEADSATLHNRLGLICKSQKEYREAERAFRRAIELEPGFAPAHNNLGTTLFEQGQFAAAEAHFKNALDLAPGNFDVLINLGITLKDTHQHGPAREMLQKALQASPGNARVINALGLAAVMRRDFDEAQQLFEEARRLAPDYADAHLNLGIVTQEQGDLPTAQAAFARALALNPEPGLRVRQALLLPPIMESRLAIQKSRARVSEAVSQLSMEAPPIADPFTQIGLTTFYLAYHGLNNRELQEDVARMHLALCPQLAHVAPHVQLPRITDRPIQIGIMLSRPQSRGVLLAYFGPAIRDLAQEDDIEVILLAPAPMDPLTEQIAARVARIAEVPVQLRAAREAISTLELDALIYLDIGTDAFTYFLAFSRLAKVQCVTTGMPDTTGIPNVDYFLSWSLAEPESAAAHYSETLAAFSHMWARPIPEMPPTCLKSRAELGLPTDRRLYVCPMKLPKLHPDFDDIALRILDRDGNGIVVLFEDNHIPAWGEIIRRRFAGSIPTILRRRIQFLPWQTDAVNLLSILGAADVILDSPHFGMGATIRQLAAVGTPYVTLPGQFQRGRMGLALSRLMRMPELVATDFSDYASKAVRIAASADVNHSLRERIRLLSRAFFESQASTRELAGFLRRSLR